MFASVEAIWMELHRVLQFASFGKAFFVIDALDECDGQSLESFLSLVTTDNFHQTSSEPRLQPCQIKWVLLSRNETAIKDHLSHSPIVLKVDMEAYSGEVRVAVDSFINVKTEELGTVKGYDEELKNFVTSTLRSKAQDTFLWVSLACRELSGPRVRSINTRLVLDKLPTGLSRLYDRVYQQVMSNEYPEMVEFARDILRSVTLATRPLSLGELAVTAGLPSTVHSNPDAIQEYLEQCGSFLATESVETSWREEASHWRTSPPPIASLFGWEFEPATTRAADGTAPLGADRFEQHSARPPRTSRTAGQFYRQNKKLPPPSEPFPSDQRRNDLNKRVHFIHQSAKDYLLNLLEGEFFSSSCTVEHKCIALRSLEYLDTLKVEEDLLKAIEGGWRYPIQNWPIHGDLALERMASAPVSGFEIFQPDSMLLQSWLQSCGFKNRFWWRSDDDCLPLQHYAAFEGVTWILERFLRNQGRLAIEQISKVDGTTPLMWAVEGGNQRATEWLLKNGADPHPSREATYASSRNPNHLVTIHTAMNLAAREFPEIFDMLLKFGADINHRSQGGQTPLGLAVFALGYDGRSSGRGLEFSFEPSEDPFSAIMRLLSRGADPNTLNDSGENPLHLAAQMNIDILSLLLKHGANPRLRDSEGQTPLHWAAYTENGEIIESLVDAGGDVNQMDNESHAAIYYAARNGSEKIVKILLDRGADMAHFKDGCKAYNAERWTKTVWEGVNLIPRPDIDFAPSVV